MGPVASGESIWNLENKFTGWYDVALSKAGHTEAAEGGVLLDEEGFKFDIAYTSTLKRAIRTCYYALEGTDCMWIPTVKAWELNERHYGSLTGLDKQETVDKYGKDQVLVWRRSFDIPPPDVTLDSEHFPGNDEKYKAIPRELLPTAESLKTTAERVLPYWENEIVPTIKAGKRVVVSAGVCACGAAPQPASSPLLVMLHPDSFRLPVCCQPALTKDGANLSCLCLPATLAVSTSLSLHVDRSPLTETACVRWSCTSTTSPPTKSLS